MDGENILAAAWDIYDYLRGIYVKIKESIYTKNC